MYVCRCVRYSILISTVCTIVYASALETYWGLAPWIERSMWQCRTERKLKTRTCKRTRDKHFLKQWTC